MPGVVRLGDVNSAGGAIIKNQVKNVFVNGKPICVVGDGVSPHSNQHNNARTSQGAPSVNANGIPVVYKGSNDSCGHPRNTCSDNVFVGTVATSPGPAGADSNSTGVIIGAIVGGVLGFAVGGVVGAIAGAAAGVAIAEGK